MTFSFNQLGNFGHLGNQMFQYAAIKGLARKHNRDFMIAPPENFGATYPTLRSSIDACFDITCERRISSFPPHSERHYHFDKETFENPPKHDIDLMGYFQSSKWFGHIADEIKKDFTFKSPYFDAASKIKEQLGKELIVIHIRRTDYVSNNNHISQDMNYFEEALKMVPSEHAVLIVSDDPEWCEQHPMFMSDRFFVSRTNDAYLDLCLITLCNFIIGANSSFSWWGCYLSNAKKIIVPKYWDVHDPERNFSDLYCDGWIRL